MNPKRWQLIKQLFDAALDLAPDQRTAFIVAQCADDPAVAHEVLNLLARHETPTSGSSKGDPVLSLVRRNAVRTTTFLTAGDSVGPYRIVGVLGEGGMGIVYLAEQERPRRTVALKVIRPGVATPGMLRRFDQETQVLGRLQHPGIAQIYEAGTANTGLGPQPYFAMELLRGKTLVEFAADLGLGTRDRLELFAKVCDAMQYAHQKGVIHRDLKPANILVDGAHQPKILDFGVARATDADVQATTLRTDIGQLLGTVPYMSPEQAGGDTDEIDVRSDVYSLGVVLYELLTGCLPYDISERPLPEAIRMIRDDEPRRLSSINIALRGDIETIVGKALLKERARRYQSAGELGADIRRYLSHEPIKARAPTAAYQIARFARQHRAHEAAEAMAINKFLQELLASAESLFSSGKANTIQGILDQAARRLEGGTLRDRPELEAELRTSMGLAYRTLGLLAQSEQHLRAAVMTRTSILGSQHPSVSASEALLGEVVGHRGRSDEAELLLRRSIETRKELLGLSHPDIAQSLCALADVLLGQGKTPEAEAMYREAASTAAAPAGARVQSAVALLGLASCLMDQGRTCEAEPVLRECMTLQSVLLPEGHWQIVTARSVLGACLGRQGKPDEAEPLLLGSWADLRTNPGAPQMARTRAVRRIVEFYESIGRSEEAADWRVRLHTLLDAEKSQVDGSM